MPRLPALFVLLAVAAFAAPRHAVLLGEAAAAVRANDNATALKKLQEAERLRPDYPRIQVNLARLYTAQGQVEEALGALERLVEMGLHFDLAEDPAFAALKDLPDFQELIERSTRPVPPAPEHDEAAFALPEVAGIIESSLVDPDTLTWYFADVRERCVWRRDTSTGVAVLTKFTHDDDALDGVFKLALSPDRKTLWAATGTVAAMQGPDAEDGKRSSLVAIDFATGRVRARYPAPDDGRRHLLGDFVIASNGTIYATDSASPVIWQLSPGATRLEAWVENDEFLGLQGIALTPDGRHLYVSDYANGLFRISRDNVETRLLQPPSTASFFGIDGLYTAGDQLFAIQNGMTPQRVLRIEPSFPGPCETTVVAINRPEMTDLALGQVFNGRLYVIGNSGWALFDPAPAAPPPPRTVTIHSIALE